MGKDPSKSLISWKSKGTAAPDYQPPSSPTNALFFRGGWHFWGVGRLDFHYIFMLWFQPISMQQGPISLGRPNHQQRTSSWKMLVESIGDGFPVMPQGITIKHCYKVRPYHVFYGLRNHYKWSKKIGNWGYFTPISGVMSSYLELVFGPIAGAPFFW